MNIIILILLILISTNANATTEISTIATNLGIGTTSTKNALSISNTLAIGDSTYTNISAPTGGMIVQGNVGIGTSQSPRILTTSKADSQIIVTSGSSASIGIINTDTTNNNFAGILANTKDTSGALALGGKIDWQFTSHTPTFVSADEVHVLKNSGTNAEVMRITAVGNMGIGTTTPPNKLYVAGTSEFQAAQIHGGEAAGNVLISNSVGLGTWMAPNTLPVTGGTSQWTTINTNDVYLPNSGNVGLGTTLTTRSALAVMNGNVGIGTWSTLNGLDVRGSVSVGTFAGVSAATANSIIVSGNIGVGLTGPASPIDVSSASNANMTLRTTGASTESYINMFNNAVQTGSFESFGSTWPAPTYYQNAVSFTAQTNNTGSLIFQTKTGAAVAAKVVILNNGNVGIGTWLPKSVLGIVGNVGIGSVVSSSYVLNSPPIGGLIVEGNVGIGTFIPGQMLEIGKVSSKIRMYDSGGVSWSCGPAVSTGVFTCTNP